MPSLNVRYWVAAEVQPDKLKPTASFADAVLALVKSNVRSTWVKAVAVTPVSDVRAFIAVDFDVAEASVDVPTKTPLILTSSSVVKLFESTALPS